MTPDLSELVLIQKEAASDDLQLIEFITRLIQEKDPLINDVKRVLDWPALESDELVDLSMPVDLTKYIRVHCPMCGASSGQACQTNTAVWVHLERMHRYDSVHLDIKAGD